MNYNTDRPEADVIKDFFQKVFPRSKILGRSTIEKYFLILLNTSIFSLRRKIFRKKYPS